MPIQDYMGDDITDSKVKEICGEPTVGENSYVMKEDVYELRSFPGIIRPFKYLLHQRGKRITETEYQQLLTLATDDAPAEPESPEE